MTGVVLVRLLGVFVVIAVGWVVARTRAIGGEDAARVLSNVAFLVFTPALLLRTTAEIDLATLPWPTLVAFFGPVVGLLLAVYGWQRARRVRPAAVPAVRAISTTFGNTVNLGLPVALALFGQAGLPLHIAIVSLHALTLLTVATVAVELDVARERRADDGSGGGVAATALLTARRTVIHPVVLPVLVGLGWNLAGIPVPGPVDDTLGVLGQAVVPVCLVAIGMSLAQYGVKGVVGDAIGLSVGKLLVQPALVLAAAHWGAGLHGLPLGVVVVCAALPIGANALLFAQRYEVLEAEVTAAIVASTLAFAVTAPLWLLIITTLAP